DINRQNVLIFFRALGENRRPSAVELAVLEASARRRLHQAFTLEAIFHSYRVGVRVLFECMIEVAPERDHGRLGILALDYADHVSRAAAQAYVEERQRVARSRQDAVRLLLTRIVNGRTTNGQDVLQEAGELGLDLERARAVLVVGRAHEDLPPTTRSDMLLARTQQRLEQAVPDTPAVLLSTGLVALLDDRHVERGVSAAASALVSQSAPDAFTIGLGSTRSGVAGLTVSYREAARARTLGRILHPTRQVYRYSDLQMFDLFREGETMDAFVAEALGPLLRLDPVRRRRAVETLDAVFDCALNRKQAARRLAIHQNTLSHRLHGIQRLLDGDLSSGEFCLRTQMALRLLPLTSTR
ncbi:MAG: PucR family transcriptional regulator, partial [Solirubrobacteraceae bacterium]